MRTGWKTVIALAFVGVVAMAAAAFGQTGGSSPGPSGAPPAATDEGGPDAGERSKRHHKPVHSETKVQTEDGFATIVRDFGTATGTDGDTVTIERADGETVSATATDATKVTRNRQPASVSDIRAGDHVVIVQVTDSDGTTVKMIHAADEAFREQMAERKSQRMERRQEFKRRFQERRGGQDAEPQDAAFFAA